MPRNGSAGDRADGVTAPTVGQGRRMAVVDASCVKVTAIAAKCARRQSWRFEVRTGMHKTANSGKT